jgi:hypothetical protein
MFSKALFALPAAAFALMAAAPAPVAVSAVKYVCPMHPKVTSNAPGKCPICGMALKRVGAQPSTQPAGAPDHDHGAHEHGGHE